MNLKKSIVFILLVFLIGVVVFIISIPKIEIIKSKSYFEEFTVKNDKVTIECYLTIKNNSNKDQSINLSAYFPEDVKGGLLVNEKLYSIEDDDNKIAYTIPANKTVTYTVTFTGEFAGNNVKANRLLPKIEIDIN